MTKINKYRGLFIIVTLCAQLLSACSDDEWDLMAEFFTVWAEENGVVVDGEIQPGNTLNTIIEDNIGDLLNSDTSVQLDGVDVIRDIEKADEIANNALLNMNPDQMLSAVNLRPYDWRLRENDGVIWLGRGNVAAAQAAFTQSDSLLKASILQQGGDCLSLRRSQLETRLEILWDTIIREESQPGWEEGEAFELRNEHYRVREMLSDINTYSDSPFCSD